MNGHMVLKIEITPLLVLPGTMRLKLDITIDYYSYRHPRCVQIIYRVDREGQTQL
jgi:hypothetical protein